MLLSGGTRHQPVQLCVSTRPPYKPHSLIKPDTRPAAASALPVKLRFAETQAPPQHLLVVPPSAHLKRTGREMFSLLISAKFHLIWEVWMKNTSIRRLQLWCFLYVSSRLCAGTLWILNPLKPSLHSYIRKTVNAPFQAAPVSLQGKQSKL